MAYKVGKEFCEKVLSGYDYCFAVHNDQAHRHVHIIFNSVNRISGYKYRYINGDWEKQIQPVTDELCRKYDLSELIYEKDGERIGRSYAEHNATKCRNLTGVDIIKMDIDHAIGQAKDLEDYYSIMKGMGYEIRTGYSKKRQAEYVSYRVPGMERSRRDYRLGKGYTLSDIKQILSVPKEERASYRPDNPVNSDQRLFPDFRLSTARMQEYSAFQVSIIRRVQQATVYLGLSLTIDEHRRVRKDLLQIDRLREEANYILDNRMTSPYDIKVRLAEVRKELRIAKKNLDQDDLKLMMLKKERRILMRIQHDTDYTMAVRQINLAGVSKKDELQYTDRLKTEDRSLWMN